MATTPTTTNTASSPATNFTVAALRRSSSHVTPTRTLLLSEHEHRESTPVRLSAEELASRPRSNQRTRTPRRYESPLDHNAFRRDAAEPEAEAADDRGTHHTRPTISEVPLSCKQGPSHRKVRRWRNDRLDDLAASHGQAAADALRKAKEKAHLYRDVVNFGDQPADPLTRFIQDDEMQGVRDKFFACELPVQAEQQHHKNKKPLCQLTAQEKLYRVDARLRRVVTKACRNSQPAAMVVKTLESFVVDTYYHPDNDSDAAASVTGQWWSTLLAEAPMVAQRRDGRVTAQFLFDAASPTGGFHRLLLHAVCQYHGLTAVSKMVKIAGKSNRALLVAGPMQQCRKRHQHQDTFLGQITSPEDAEQVQVLEEPWTTLCETQVVAEEGGWAVVKT